MRSSKDRTIEKKRRSKAMKVQQTEASRKKRLANKAKRKEIHAIDPNMKIVVKNQKTYDQHGNEVEVINGKIKPVLVNGVYNVVEEKTYNAESDGGRAINDQIEKERIGVFDRLADRFRKK
jgi:uncharacterized protein YcbK (DUF882 family)